MTSEIWIESSKPAARKERGMEQKIALSALGANKTSKHTRSFQMLITETLTLTEPSRLISPRMIATGGGGEVKHC